MQDKTSQVLKNVKRIEIKTRCLVDGLLQGAYHSVFKGRGIEFSSVREYVLGDEIRAIDWNVTARMNKPYVKEYIEERDLTVYIVFDVSSSNSFGSEREKKDNAAEIAASLMFAALKNNDKIGLCLFTDGIEHYAPPRKGKRHVMRLLRQILYYEPGKKTTDLNKTLLSLSRIAKKKSIIFVISDFMTQEFTKPLKILRRKHDVIAINMQDIREQDIPDVGYIELEDSETGEQILVDTSDKEFRENYAKLVREKNQGLRKKLRKLNTDMILVRSDESFEVPLKKFFELRKRRMSRYRR